MHFMPDTEDQDSAAETFWPEGYKLVVRENAPSFFTSALLKENPFVTIYERDYQAAFPDYPMFLEKLADMLSIGLENGADNGFDEIIDSFLKEAPLPRLRPYAHYFPVALLGTEIKEKLSAIISTEYSRDNVYVYAYGVGYKKIFPNFDIYIARISELVVGAAQNAANDTLENIFRNFYLRAPLPPVRRHPRRLKMW